jgi:sec-independent protein translocase protein TatA
MGPLEILVIVLFALLIFGASRLPKIGRGMGQGLRGFRHELSDGLKDIKLEPEEQSERGAATPRAAERR